MKKITSIIALVLNVQFISAHPTTNQHVHEALINEWAWIVIPSIVLLALIWKLGRKYFLNKNEM